MKTVALTTIGSLGDLHPYLAIANALQNRGVRARIVTSPSRRGQIERLGYEFRPMEPELTPEGAAADGTLPRILSAHGGTRFLIRELIAPHIRKSYADLSEACRGVELLFTHPITFAGPILAEKTGIPWASGVLSPASMLSDYDPFIVSQTRFFETLRRFGPIPIRPFTRAIRALTYSWIKPLIEFRAEVGLPTRTHPLFEGQHAPALVLALFSKAFAAPQPDWPEQSRTTGFPLIEDNNDAIADGLARFLDAGDPPVVFTLGSSASLGPGSFYHESALAAQTLGIRALLLTGPDPYTMDGLPLSGDIYATPYAPYSQIFPRCCAVVHSGGIGTTAQGLRAGKPMLVVPFSNDQPDNASRVRRMGAGLDLSKSRYRHRRVAIELDHLLTTSSYARSAHNAAKIMSDENGAAAAAEALINLL